MKQLKRILPTGILLGIFTIMTLCPAALHTYKTNSNNFAFADQNQNYTNSFDAYYYTGENEQSYNNQGSVEDGQIVYLSSYMSQNHNDYHQIGGNHTIYPNGNVDTDFDFSMQIHTSLYLKYECNYSSGLILQNGRYWSEANCSLNAMFNVLRSWSKKSIISIPYDYFSQVEDYATEINNDSLFDEYGNGSSFLETITNSNGEQETIRCIWRQNRLRLSNNSLEEVIGNLNSVYMYIRSYAIREHNYTPVSGYNINNVPATMEWVAHMFWENIDVISTNSLSDALQAIDEGKAVYMAIQNSGTYGSHAVALIGYNEYYINNPNNPLDRKYIFRIADGWNTSARYFDPNTNNGVTYSFCILNDV